MLSVKFVDSAQARVEAGTLVSNAGWNLKPVATLAQSHSASFRQRLDAGACGNLNAMIAMAEQNTGLTQPDFEGFHTIEFSQVRNGSQFLATYNDLVARSEIEYAAIQPAGVAPPPSVTPDYTPLQTDYRGPNPGADFAFAHAQGLTGFGMRLSELSPTYDRQHEEFIHVNIEHDLPTPPLGFEDAVCPVSNPGDWDCWVDHGSATLGQNLAPDNGFGVTGMTYDAAGFLYQTGERTESSVTWRFEEAYCNALGDSVAAGTGHIVYWEHQACNPSGPGFCRPVEVDVMIHQLTRTGTDAGVVVLMPAGNGNVNLDTSSVVSQWRSWPDSGSIIVGAGRSVGNQERLGFSTYGQRVGPQGWGENVVTTGYDDLDEVDDDIHRRYTAAFAGTSSATPMVAGAALLTQQRAISLGLTPLSSREMRSFLQQTGIPQGGSVTGNIGAFIDLEAAITQIADADLSIVTTTQGTMITTTVTNNGPRTAENVEVGITYYTPGAHTLVADSVPSTCAFSPQVPIPPGAQCPGQCPSLLVCDFTGLAAGASKIIRVDVTGSSHAQQFQIESDVRLEDGSEVQDPDESDNYEHITVTVGPPSA